MFFLKNHSLNLFQHISISKVLHHILYTYSAILYHMILLCHIITMRSLSDQLRPKFMNLPISTSVKSVNMSLWFYFACEAAATRRSRSLFALLGWGDGSGRGGSGLWGLETGMERWHERIYRGIWDDFLLEVLRGRCFMWETSLVSENIQSIALLKEGHQFWSLPFWSLPFLKSFLRFRTQSRSTEKPLQKSCWNCWKARNVEICWSLLDIEM